MNSSSTRTDRQLSEMISIVSRAAETESGGALVGAAARAATRVRRVSRRDPYRPATGTGWKQG
jgi:hypothetical protein